MHTTRCLFKTHDRPADPCYRYNARDRYDSGSEMFREGCPEAARCAARAPRPNNATPYALRPGEVWLQLKIMDLGGK